MVEGDQVQHLGLQGGRGESGPGRSAGFEKSRQLEQPSESLGAGRMPNGNLIKCLSEGDDGFKLQERPERVAVRDQSIAQVGTRILKWRTRLNVAMLVGMALSKVGARPM